jgi:Immunity protein 53
MTPIDRLSEWYRAQCNDVWEHSYGVSIGTLDNPGWLVKIDIVGTNLEGRTFIAEERGDPEQFVAAGGAGNLTELLDVFLTWGEVP